MGKIDQRHISTQSRHHHEQQHIVKKAQTFEPRIKQLFHLGRINSLTSQLMTKLEKKYQHRRNEHLSKFNQKEKHQINVDVKPNDNSETINNNPKNRLKSDKVYQNLLTDKTKNYQANKPNSKFKRPWSRHQNPNELASANSQFDGKRLLSKSITIMNDNHYISRFKTGRSIDNIYRKRQEGRDVSDFNLDRDRLSFHQCDKPKKNPAQNDLENITRKSLISIENNSIWPQTLDENNSIWPQNLDKNNSIWPQTFDENNAPVESPTIKCKRKSDRFSNTMSSQISNAQSRGSRRSSTAKKYTRDGKLIEEQEIRDPKLREIAKDFKRRDSLSRKFILRNSLMGESMFMSYGSLAQSSHSTKVDSIKVGDRTADSKRDILYRYEKIRSTKSKNLTRKAQEKPSQVVYNNNFSQGERYLPVRENKETVVLKKYRQN